MAMLLSHLGKRQRALMASLFMTLAGTAVVAARRDLAHRSPDAVRGNYEIWRRLTWLPGPSTAYLLFARRARRDPSGP